LHDTSTVTDGNKVVSMLNRVPIVVFEMIGQYIYGVGTHPDYRRHGYAGKLIKDALQTPVYEFAALVPENPSLIGFYRRLGFARRGYLPRDGRAVLVYDNTIMPEKVYIELAQKIQAIENGG
jgi:ribosomal protein S18 acetylase RimI-like enzyme